MASECARDVPASPRLELNTVSADLAEVYGAEHLRRARSLTEGVLREPPVVVPSRQLDFVRPDGSG